MYRDAHVTSTSKVKGTTGRSTQLIQAKGEKGKVFVCFEGTFTQLLSKVPVIKSYLKLSQNNINLLPDKQNSYQQKPVWVVCFLFVCMPIQDHFTKNVTIKCTILRTGQYLCVFKL